MPEGYGEDAANCALSLVSDVLEVIPGAGQVKDVFDLVVDSIDAVKTSWEISNKIIEGYDVDLTNGAFVGTQFHTSKEIWYDTGNANIFTFIVLILILVIIAVIALIVWRIIVRRKRKKASQKQAV